MYKQYENQRGYDASFYSFNFPFQNGLKSCQPHQDRIFHNPKMHFPEPMNLQRKSIDQKSSSCYEASSKKSLEKTPLCVEEKDLQKEAKISKERSMVSSRTVDV